MLLIYFGCLAQGISGDTLSIQQANSEAFQLYGVDAEKMLKVGQEALAVSKSLEYERGIAGSYNTMALAYMSMSQYEKAIESFLKALDIYEKLNAQKYISSILNNVGVVYYYIEDHEQSLNYHQQALSSRQLLGDSINISKSYNNIGIAYKSMGQLDQALEYYKNALLYKENLGDSLSISTTLNNIGNVLLEQGVYREAKDYFLQSLVIDSLYQKGSGMATSYLNLGAVSIKMNQFLVAKKHLNRAIALSKDYSAKQTKMLVFEKMKELFEVQKDYEKAFFWSQKWISLKDSLNELANSRAIGELQSKYENEKIQIENDLLKEREKLKDEQIDQQTKLLALGSIIFVLFIMFIFYFMRSYRFKQINFKIQVEKTKKIQKQNELILKQKNELQEINEAKNKMFAILSHDIKAPFNNLVSFMFLASQKVLTEEEMQQMLKDLAEEATNVSDLLTNILEWMKTQMNGLIIEKKSLSLHSIVEEVLVNASPLAKTKGITLKNMSMESDAPYGDENLTKTIIRNLVGNAIKYTSNGSVSVYTKFQEEEYVISVVDTGVGMSEADIQRIYSNDYFSTVGTADELGTGVGLILIKEFVVKNDGVLKIKSELGIGSTFTFTLPNGKGSNIQESTKLPYSESISSL